MRVRILVSSPSDNRSLIRPFGPPSPPEGGRLGTGGPMCPPLRANQNISRRAGEDTRPYGGNRPRDVGLDHPGAGMEPQQRQFLQTQGPVARREFRHPLRFCAPEGFCLLQGVTPVNRGPGADFPCQGEMSRSDKGGRVGEYGHGVSILSRPPVILKVNCPEGAREGGLGHWFLSHRWERNSPPAGGETPLRKEPSSGPMRASGPTKSVLSSPPHPAPSGPPSLSPLAFGHLSLTRGVGPRGEGFRRRAAKPPPRHRGRKPKHRNPCGRADREKTPLPAVPCGL